MDASPEKVDAQRHQAAQLTARSNVFIERFWRTIKYEEIYLKAYDSVLEARRGIERFMQWYNHGRPHSSVDKRPPIEAYQALLPALAQAA